jgi:hypothetical protein
LESWTVLSTVHVEEKRGSGIFKKFCSVRYVTADPRASSWPPKLVHGPFDTARSLFATCLGIEFWHKLFERSGGGNCEAIFPTERREMIFCVIPMTEKWPLFLHMMTEKRPFWFWTDTGDNIFFSVGNQFFLFYNFNTTTHGAQ